MDVHVNLFGNLKILFGSLKKHFHITVRSGRKYLRIRGLRGRLAYDYVFVGRGKYLALKVMAYESTKMFFKNMLK